MGLLGPSILLKVFLVSLIAVWFATAYWAYSDARRRMGDPLLIGCAFAGAALFPFVGAIVYFIVRPPETLKDARERALEMQAAEARLHTAGFLPCPHCDAEIGRDYLRCPACMKRLKEPCRTCKRPLEAKWKVCPFCDAEVSPKQVQRPRRRRASKTAGDKSPVREAPPAT